MNCKPGDLAYIVAPYYKPARGRVVTVERAAVDGEVVDGVGYFDEGRSTNGGWVVFCPSGVPLAWGGLVPKRLCIADECLRPIRYSGDDLREDAPIWRREPEVVS